MIMRETPARLAPYLIFLIVLVLSGCRSSRRGTLGPEDDSAFVGTPAQQTVPGWLPGIDLGRLPGGQGDLAGDAMADLMTRYAAESAIIHCTWSQLQPDGPGTAFQWATLVSDPVLAALPHPIALVDLDAPWIISGEDQNTSSVLPVGSREFLSELAGKARDLRITRFILRVPADRSFTNFSAMLPYMVDTLIGTMPEARVFVEIPPNSSLSKLQKIIPRPWPAGLQGISISLPFTRPEFGVPLLSITSFRAELEAMGASDPTIILQQGWGAETLGGAGIPASMADEQAWRNGIRRLSKARNGFSPEWVEAAFFSPTSYIASALPRLGLPSFCPARLTLRSLDGHGLDEPLIQAESYRFQVAFENQSTSPITSLQLGLAVDPESMGAVEIHDVVNPLIPMLPPGGKAMAEFIAVSPEPSRITLLQPFATGQWDQRKIYDETWYPVRVEPVLEGSVSPQRIVFAWPYISQPFRLNLINRDRSDHIEGGLQLEQSPRSRLMLVGSRDAILPPRGGNMLELRLVPPQNLKPGHYPIQLEGRFESLPAQRPIHFSLPILVEAALPVATAPRPIQLDGMLEDWTDITAVPAYFPAFPDAGQEEAMPADATARFTWDEHAMYLALTPPESSTNTGFSSIAIAIDPEGNSPVDDERSDDLLYEVLVYHGRPVVLRLIAPEPLRTGVTRFMGIGLAQSEEGKATALEMALPWQELGHIPSSGLLLPIAFQWIDEPGLSPETLQDPWTTEQTGGWNHYVLQIDATAKP